MSKPFKIVALTGVVIPETSGIQRKHVRSEARRSAHYIEKYDSSTLLYDCFYNPEKKCYTITAPRFLNLWELVKHHLYIDQKQFQGKIKRHRWQRCEQVDLIAPNQGQLKIQSNNFSADIPVRSSERTVFANLNVAMAMNRNNQLTWIRDWAQFHVNAHGLEGVCIIDNASSDYSPSDLLRTLESVKGLKSAVVLTAPFPYGPVDSSKKLEISPRFLQTSMFNLLKQDFFADARAILSVDIDELVVPKASHSVFDAAVRASLGAVSFRELKVYPNQEEARAYDHKAHVWVKKDQKYGNTKWCVSGNGFLNRFGWAVHRFGGAFFPFTETKEFVYLHCQNTTTSWKKNRFKEQPDLVKDEWVAKALSTHLR